MITDDQKQMIQDLKRLSQSAKKAPWPEGDNVGKQVYKLVKLQEDLITMTRNSVDELIKVIEKQQEVLSFYADENNYDNYSQWEQTSPIMQDRGTKASSVEAGVPVFIPGEGK